MLVHSPSSLSDDSIILLSEVSLKVGQDCILSKVNANIHSGEFIGIFGPNGSGKTTLVRALLGLIPCSSGTMTLFGGPIRRGSRLIGYMPQAITTCETGLSVRAVIMAVQVGEHWGMPCNNAAAVREVEEVLELVQLSHLAEAPFYQLSGGEKQRVQLAQALLGNPKLLILDEPLASLDPYHQQQLVDIIRNVKKITGVTVLFIAHDINPLLHIIDRVWYLAGGKAVLGTLEEVISNNVLSNLYNASMHVIRAEGRIFIVNADSNILETTCCGHSHA
ncbi:MAG: ATP-binding cassette domain-containing protein [Chthoniobacterales bacterium]|nr:ATP-binding cassette domain-containing protein [Chthoniobacterales bacterium]